MSEFNKSMESFKCQDTHNITETKVVKMSDNNTIPHVKPNLNITELSPEQRHAYTKFVKGENLFITGPGGTGKTHLIRHLIEFSTSINKNIPICAMTGCAAVLLECNARTLHSWSGIKLAKGDKESVISGVLRNKHTTKRWKKAN